MFIGGVSEPRNRVMLKMFNLIGVGEHAGSGVPEILEVWKNEKLDPPFVEEQFGPDRPDRTTLTLPLVSSASNKQQKQTIKTSDKKGAIKTSDKKRTVKTQQHIEKIILYLNKAGESKISDIAEYIGLSEVRTRAIIAEVENIEALGGNRNRTYRLKK